MSLSALRAVSVRKVTSETIGRSVSQTAVKLRPDSLKNLPINTRVGSNASEPMNRKRSRTMLQVTSSAVKTRRRRLAVIDAVSPANHSERITSALKGRFASSNANSNLNVFKKFIQFISVSVRFRGCFCANGFYRNLKDECVTADKCVKVGKASQELDKVRRRMRKQCKEDEVFKECGNHCVQLCIPPLVSPVLFHLGSIN